MFDNVLLWRVVDAFNCAYVINVVVLWGVIPCTSCNCMNLKVLPNFINLNSLYVIMYFW